MKYDMILRNDVFKFLCFVTCTYVNSKKYYVINGALVLYMYNITPLDCYKIFHDPAWFICLNSLPFLKRFVFELMLFRLLPASFWLGDPLDGGAGLKQDIFQGCGGFSLVFC